MQSKISFLSYELRITPYLLHIPAPKTHPVLSSELRRMLHRRRFRRIATSLTLAALIAFIALVHDLPAPTAANLRAARPSTLIFDRNGQRLFEAIGDGGKQQSLTFAQIPPACWQATVAVEDKRFFRHPGVDVAALARAVWQNTRYGTVISGASTITQQVARNTLMSAEERVEQTLRRKLREAWLAVQIELRYSKQEILALYLNQIYFGNFAYGLEAAAHGYFGKSAAELDVAECSLLAGLVQNPAVYNPLYNSDLAQQRQRTVLHAMTAAGYLASSEADLALTEPLQFAATPLPIEAPHFVSYVETQLERILGVERVAAGGLRVVTTLDLSWNQAAQQSMAFRLQQLATERNAPPDRRVENAAVVVLDAHDGSIRVMVGSPDYFNAAIDGALNATIALRQPGSALKPLTYAAALDPARAAATGRAPMTAATVLADVRTGFITAEGQPYVPQNYDLQWHGPVSVRTALANSYNTPAVKTLQAIGITALIDQARRQGITSFQPDDGPTPRYGLALTLGGGEVSLLELSAAYAVFATQGQRVTPNAIARIEAEDGTLLWQAPSTPATQTVLDARVAFLITDILSDNDARVPAFGRNSVLALSFPAAVKTGTSTDWRDNWTVGYTSDLVTGVWVGNADNSPMLGISGVSGAGPIWRDVMQTIHKNRPAPAFTIPQGLTRTAICIDSGLLPTRWCTRQRSEWFITGTQPQTYDTIYQPVDVDTCRGGLATAATSPACRRQEIRRVYPPELRAWAEAQGISQPADMAAAAPAPTQTDAAAAPALRWLSPDANSSYRLSTGLNNGSQQIRLAVQPAGISGLHTVAFEVDGLPAGQVTRAPYEIWWPLQAGPHQIIAIAATDAGQQISSVVLHIEVE